MAKVPRPLRARVPAASAASGVAARGVVPLLLVLALGACDDARSGPDESSVRMIPVAEEPADQTTERGGDAVSTDAPSEEAPGSPAAGAAGPAVTDEGGPDPDGDTSPVAGSGPTEAVAAPADEAPREPTSTRPRAVRRVPLRVDAEPDPVERDPVESGAVEPGRGGLEPTDGGGMTLHFDADPALRPPAVPVGATVEAVMETALSTETSRSGDRFRARLEDDVIAGDGLVLIPRGALVRGRVVESRESEASDRPAVLALQAESLVIDGRSYELVGTVVDVEMTADSRPGAGETAAKVGVGAAAGAVLGKILGGDGRDALKGAAAGAAAGAAVALATRNGHATIAEGARLVIRVDRPVVLDRRR